MSNFWATFERYPSNLCKSLAIWLQGEWGQVMSLSDDRRGAQRDICEVGVANFLLKSWRKTSAYEIRTFQYGEVPSRPRLNESSSGYN